MSGNRQKTKGMTACPDKIKEPRIKNQEKGNLWRHSLFYTLKKKTCHKMGCGGLA
jgi:hypothetical protein